MRLLGSNAKEARLWLKRIGYMLAIGEGLMGCSKDLFLILGCARAIVLVALDFVSIPCCVVPPIMLRS